VRALRVLCLAAVLIALSGSAALALDISEDDQPPPAEAGTPYEFQFKGEEGCVPYRFKYLNGTVPPGLRITEDGKLTGTPTEAGNFDFWVGLIGGFSTVCIFCFLCLMDDYCSELVCNVNVPAARLCETRYTFPVNCLTGCGTGM